MNEHFERAQHVTESRNMNNIATFTKETSAQAGEMDRTGLKIRLCYCFTLCLFLNV
jgi:hypothetical protein